MGRIVLVGGGARSGKSAFALARARALGVERGFVATALPVDDEMCQRIARHVKERDGGFRTVEAPYDLPNAVEAFRGADVVVIDCLTLWLSNLLVRGDSEATIEGAVERLTWSLTAAPFATVVVTNEVGMGIVPDSALGRQFRDITGRAHQKVAAAAAEVHAALLGCILRLRPAPVVESG